MKLGVLALALAACGGPAYHLMGPVVHDISAPAASGAKGEGPLSVRAKIADTPWPERQQLLDRARHVYLDRSALAEDAAAYLKLVAELFPNPTAPEQREGITQARHELALLDRLAPYALDATSVAYAGLYARLPLCALPPGEKSHCYPALVVPPRAKAPFEVGEAAPGVALLAIHDLEGTWQAPVDQLAAAHAIVVDLRDAVGTDPRPVLPWLERVTGRAPFEPLQAIRRPADLDPYVAAYAARYTTEMRDRHVWASLVGEMPAAVDPLPQRIAVIVGLGCGPACELVARSLVTYAHATLYGSVGPWARLDRDEHALMVLPHSKIEIYFNATEYVLAADIERATGPTPEWNLRTRDSIGDDIVAFAARELAQPHPPCSTFPAYTTAGQIPAAVRPKIPNAYELTSCSWTPDISIQTKAPRSAIERFVQTCHDPVTIENAYGDQLLVSTRSLAPLTQLAQSDLVTSIAISCAPPPEPN